jgi:hypothetical protein
MVGIIESFTLIIILGLLCIYALGICIPSYGMGIDIPSGCIIDPFITARDY